MASAFVLFKLSWFSASSQHSEYPVSLVVRLVDGYTQLFSSSAYCAHFHVVARMRFDSGLVYNIECYGNFST